MLLGTNIQTLSPLLFTVAVLFFINSSVYAQNNTSASIVNESHIDLSKVSSSNTIISNETSFVGSFGTIYTITGPAYDIKNSKDLIISSILNDFTNTSTIGYVKLSDSDTNSDKHEIANPFASNDQITQKIKQSLDKSILDATNIKSGLVTIKCNFGSSLEAFSCSSYRFR